VAEDLVGEEVQTLIQRLTPAAEQAKILEQMQAGRERPYHTQCLTKEGTVVAVKATARHIDYRGRTVRLVILQPLDEASALPLELEQANLTPQQQAVLQEMANGSPDKEIGERLGIAPTTVNHHKKQIFEKLQVDTRIQAIVWAWQNLIPPE
jgi:DNA-binding NarL/FixJ family response regulator